MKVKKVTTNWTPKLTTEGASPCRHGACPRAALNGMWLVPGGLASTSLSLFFGKKRLFHVFKTMGIKFYRLSPQTWCFTKNNRLNHPHFSIFHRGPLPSGAVRWSPAEMAWITSGVEVQRPVYWDDVEVSCVIYEAEGNGTAFTALFVPVEVGN